MTTLGAMTQQDLAGLALSDKVTGLMPLGHEPPLHDYMESVNAEPAGTYAFAIYGTERDSTGEYRYRYVLGRVWDARPVVNFLMLNPSTATERMLDPTLRRCMAYARAWDHGGFLVTNLFAYRATDPRVMKTCIFPVGEANNEWIVRAAKASSRVVAGWGAHGGHRSRDATVLRLFHTAKIPLSYLRMTQGGYPGHPLYMPSTLTPIVWDHVR